MMTFTPFVLFTLCGTLHVAKLQELFDTSNYRVITNPKARNFTYQAERCKGELHSLSSNLFLCLGVFIYIDNQFIMILSHWVILCEIGLKILLSTRRIEQKYPPLLYTVKYKMSIFLDPGRVFEGYIMWSQMKPLPRLCYLS